MPPWYMCSSRHTSYLHYCGLSSTLTCVTAPPSNGRNNPLQTASYHDIHDIDMKTYPRFISSNKHHAIWTMYWHQWPSCSAKLFFDLFLYLPSLTLRRLMSYIYMEHLFLMFLDHTQRCTTVGRTPLDEWSARRRDLYLTTHDTHNRQISMPPVGF